MGKILGKSALCFAGLAIASWLIQILCDWVLQLYPKPLFFGLIWMFVLELILWLLLPLAYAYLLFLLFRNDKHCYLILALNGVFVIVQYYMLLILHIGGEVILASLQASKVAGIPVMLLALMFKQLKAPNEKLKVGSAKSRTKGLLGILAKSVLCFLALVIGTYGFSLLCSLPITIFGYVGFFIQDPLCAFPLIFIAYAYLLFRLLGKYRHRLWIMGTNAVFLMALSAARLFIPSLYSLSLPAFLTGYFTGHAIAIFGNAAILLPILAFIFRSVEKHQAVLTTNQNALYGSITAHSDIS